MYAVRGKICGSYFKKPALDRYSSVSLWQEAADISTLAGLTTFHFPKNRNLQNVVLIARKYTENAPKTKTR
jgi:hypothetical protein